MSKETTSRRDFLKRTGTAACAAVLPSGTFLGLAARLAPRTLGPAFQQAELRSPDYVLRIASNPVEIAPKHIVSTITYNGQFSGPLLRFKEGQAVTVEVHNDTDTPEQLHWHGQMVPTDVDGASEEGTPFIPARGMRRIVFTPRPSGFRFYHTHNRAGADLHAGQYSGQVGPVYIEPKREPGSYDREVFLVLKEFEPSFSKGGDMAQDFPTPATRVKERNLWRIGDESLAHEGDAAQLRSGLSVFHDQWSDVWARRAGEGEAGRARALSRSERHCNRDSQPCIAWAHVQGCSAGR